MIGGVIASLIYVFHPGVGQFSLVFIGILTFLAFLGVGMFMFMAALFAVMLGVFIVAPYFWPVLIIIFLMILLMSSGNGQKTE